MLFKKRASYPSIVLLLLPLVAHAVEVPALSDELQGATPPRCVALEVRLDTPARQMLRDFYQLRNGLPAWTSPARRQELREQLDSLSDDGLDPTDYPLEQGDADCIELQASHSFLSALLHLRRGRLLPSQQEAIWRSPQDPRPDPYLATLSIANLDQPLAMAFTAARPQLPQYQRLREAYALLRQQPLGQWQALAEGPLLKPGARDGRVPALRDRLQAGGYLAAGDNPNNLSFDPATVAALLTFQQQHGLKPDGVLGPSTLTELNIDALTRRDQLRVNLERLRRMVDDLERARVTINVAGAELHVLEQGREVWRTRTQVGRPGRETPLLSSAITRLTLNPTWTVPPTILREDKLPEIRADVGYLARHDMVVLDRSGRRLNPEMVDWSSPGRIVLRQNAGTANPLGRMVLRFDNPFAVYLHDTPSQALFERYPRLFSSGCVRVEAVTSLLPWLMPADEVETVQQRIASGRTQSYRLSQSAPLLIGYWTAEVGADGSLRYLPDLYQLDAALLTELLSTRP